MNSKKRQREVDHVDQSEIIPNRHVFVSIVGWEIEEKVPLKPPATSPLTISCVSSTECQTFLNVENVLGSTQTRVISTHM